MKALQAYGTVVINELNKIGIYPGKIVEWKVRNQNDNLWAYCSPTKGGFVIEVSCLLLSSNVTDDVLKGTIAHELLHTLPGCMNHGKQWQKYAQQVNKYYNYNIHKLSSCEDKGLPHNAFSNLHSPIHEYDVTVQYDNNYRWWDVYRVKAYSYENAREEALQLAQAGTHVCIKVTDVWQIT